MKERELGLLLALAEAVEWLIEARIYEGINKEILPIGDPRPLQILREQISLARQIMDEPV